jgi:hypothetical protein
MRRCSSFSSIQRNVHSNQEILFHIGGQMLIPVTKCEKNLKCSTLQEKLQIGTAALKNHLVISGKAENMY